MEVSINQLFNVPYVFVSGNDVVVMKHLRRGEHDLDAINDELDERGCSLLGWKPREN